MLLFDGEDANRCQRLALSSNLCEELSFKWGEHESGRQVYCDSFAAGQARQGDGFATVYSAACRKLQAS